jgi:hypothetical protein
MLFARPVWPWLVLSPALSVIAFLSWLVEEAL